MSVTSALGRFAPNCVHSTFGPGANARDTPNAPPTSSTSSGVVAFQRSSFGTNSTVRRFALKSFCEIRIHLSDVPLQTGTPPSPGHRMYTPTSVATYATRQSRGSTTMSRISRASAIASVSQRPASRESDTSFGVRTYTVFPAAA